MFGAESAVREQHTVHTDHNDGGSEQPEQINTSSADQPRKLSSRHSMASATPENLPRYLFDA